MSDYHLLLCLTKTFMFYPHCVRHFIFICHHHLKHLLSFVHVQFEPDFCLAFGYVIVLHGLCLGAAW